MAKKGGKPVTEIADDEVHVPLQAVLLADSFTQKFRPITLERPKVRECNPFCENKLSKVERVD